MKKELDVTNLNNIWKMERFGTGQKKELRGR